MSIYASTCCRGSVVKQGDGTYVCHRCKRSLSLRELVDLTKHINSRITGDISCRQMGELPSFDVDIQNDNPPEPAGRTGNPSGAKPKRTRQTRKPKTKTPKTKKKK